MKPAPQDEDPRWMDAREKYAIRDVHRQETPQDLEHQPQISHEVCPSGASQDGFRTPNFRV